jgi:hypothetical protein
LTRDLIDVMETIYTNMNINCYLNASNAMLGTAC